MPRAEAVSRTSVADAVLTDLREAISSGAIPVGTRLPAEAVLSERYGVSRPLVREALRSLQALGLTRTRTGSGTFVIADRLNPSTTFGDFSSRDLVEARPHVEVPAAGFAAERRSE